MFLAYEATKDLFLDKIQVETPLAITDGFQIPYRIGLMPILRAGLGMLDPILDLLPTAEVWNLGFYRNEETLEPVAYYQKLPPGKPVEHAFILDPMVATGGSAKAAVHSLKEWGAKKIRLLSLIAAPKGLQELTTVHPDIAIYVCAIDSHLNDKAYIIPGLGDAGDRIFNTLIK